MPSVLALAAVAALAAAYAYVRHRFDDPAVPVVFDLFPADATPPYTVLEIWAHPDDETSMGGTTAVYGRHPQVRVVACYFTCGEWGKPGVPPICAQEELGDVRRGEMALAARAAGMDAHEVADFGDGRLETREPEALEAQAVRWIRTYRPTLLFSWDLSGASGHPDHRCTHAVVRRAFHSAADPARFPEQLTDDGLTPHQTRCLYETVVPARLVERYRRAAFRGNTHALDDRAGPTHAMYVGGTARVRAAIVRAHRTQHKGLEPFSRWFGPFIYWGWRKEYFTLAATAEPSANQ